MRMGALRTHQDSSMRLRPWAALLLFVSAYAPLLIILIIKDYDPQQVGFVPRHPMMCLGLLMVAGKAPEEAEGPGPRQVDGDVLARQAQGGSSRGELFSSSRSHRREIAEEVQGLSEATATDTRFPS